MLTPAEIGRLEAYLTRALGEGGALKIDNLVRIHGGASRQTYSFDGLIMSRGMEGRRGFILRRDPPASLIDTDRALEFAAYRSMVRENVPAPRPLALVTDRSVLGAPFFIMERVENSQGASPFNAKAFGAHAKSIGGDFFDIMGRIHAIDPARTELAQVTITPDPRASWKRELDHWTAIIAQDALEPQPIVWAAIRRLRANPPPPPRRCTIVHGDYRIGNFLHDGAGAITAILDWELAHIGDPIEDLGWALDPLWSQGRTDLAAGLLPMEEAIEIWEDAADEDFDAERFRWWSLFAHVKGVAIWLTSSRTFHEGKNSDPVLAFSGWYCLTRHNQIIAERLAAAPRGLI